MTMIGTLLAAATAIAMMGLTLTDEEREKLEFLAEHGQHADRVAEILLRLDER